MQQQKTLVSIIMLTYNHQEFIRQAVEAALGQQTDFVFELIIANDNSPDRTDDIIQEIMNIHPKANRIKYYRNEPNLGVMRNAKKALDMAEGKYLALCEGDDYWTDSHKLQKQVNFLELNPGFAICFHNTRIEYFEENQPPFLLNENIEKDVFELKDLIGEDEIWFMATASVMLRAEAYGKSPDWLVESKSGDIPMFILTARNGKIKYLPDVMAVYRKHAEGISLTDHKDDAQFLRNRIFMYDMLNKETNYAFNKLFKRNIARYYFMMLKSRQYKGRYLATLPLVLKYLTLTLPSVPHLKVLIRDHVIPPAIIQIFRWLKRQFGLMPSS